MSKQWRPSKSKYRTVRRLSWFLALVWRESPAGGLISLPLAMRLARIED